MTLVLYLAFFFFFLNSYIVVVPLWFQRREQHTQTPSNSFLPFPPASRGRVKGICDLHAQIHLT